MYMSESVSMYMIMLITTFPFFSSYTYMKDTTKPNHKFIESNGVNLSILLLHFHRILYSQKSEKITKKWKLTRKKSKCWTETEKCLKFLMTVNAKTNMCCTCDKWTTVKCDYCHIHTTDLQILRILVGFNRSEDKLYPTEKKILPFETFGNCGFWVTLLHVTH